MIPNPFLLKEKAADEGIYWHIDFENFHQYLFDEVFFTVFFPSFLYHLCDHFTLYL